MKINPNLLAFSLSVAAIGGLTSVLLLTDTPVRAGGAASAPESGARTITGACPVPYSGAVAFGGAASAPMSGAVALGGAASAPMSGVRSLATLADVDIVWSQDLRKVTALIGVIQEFGSGASAPESGARRITASPTAVTTVGNLLSERLAELNATLDAVIASDSLTDDDKRAFLGGAIPQLSGLNGQLTALNDLLNATLDDAGAPLYGCLSSNFSLSIKDLLFKSDKTAGLLGGVN